MAHFIALVLQALIEAYITFMPLRVVLWTFAFIAVAVGVFAAARSYGAVGVQ